jgi:glycosyltransferase involved in cell wall biosynthesis
MRILTALTFYRPHWTGLTAHAVSVAEGLAARGHQVTVLTTRHTYRLARDETINGVRIVRLAPIGRFSRGMITPAYPYAAAGLIAQHDVVQIHTPFPEAPWIALLCRALRKPLLMTHHGDVVMPEGRLNQFIERAAFVLMRLVGEMADAVTSYSRDYAESSRLLRTFDDKLAYVYPPVEIPRPDGRAPEWRRELGLEGRTLIGFAGRWVEEKGFDYLLRALPLIRAECPTAHLVYAGDPHVVYEDFFERCQPLIEAQREHLTFLGLIRDPQRMANFYAMCNVFALPSRSDMMALVQVESMLCGTPVVATDIPGARVVVRETGMGRLAPPQDPAGLAEAILETLRNPDRYRPSEAGVRAIFDSERSLRQYEDLLVGILHKRR